MVVWHFAVKRASPDPLQKVLHDLELRREGMYSALQQQIEHLMQSERRLREETGHLVNALRSPNVRGHWGQMHLRRVVEVAGLLPQCDFYEQELVTAGERTLRPDLIVRLPQNRAIAVDAKAPIEGYLEALRIEDPDLRKERLRNCSELLRRQIKDLAGKQYGKHVAGALEYTILFLPSEGYYSAMLEIDVDLLEVAAAVNIILAAPHTLIALLKAIGQVWRQEALTQNAKQICELGKLLYERVAICSEHWKKLGKELGGAVEAYNSALASWNTRVQVTALKLKECGASQGEALEELKSLEASIPNTK